MRFYNPDGGEIEKGGNGLRIFSRYLWDTGLVQEEPLTISTAGGEVTSRVHQGGGQVTVEMGAVSFDSCRIPVAGPPREVLNETILVGGRRRAPYRRTARADLEEGSAGRELRFCVATIGDPHCVVLCDHVSAQEAQRWGPVIETDGRFPNRTNVQFMRVLDRSNIQIEIWERGAGYTLASGSSSCAAAAVAYRLGLCDDKVTVQLPGGEIDISISQVLAITMTGPVAR